MSETKSITNKEVSDKTKKLIKVLTDASNEEFKTMLESTPKESEYAAGRYDGLTDARKLIWFAFNSFLVSNDD